MELNLTVSISARHIPFETYKRIRKIISWQVENKHRTPFYRPRFRKNIEGDSVPSFTHTGFISHSSADKNSRGSKFFNSLADELIDEFDFSTQETRALDLVLIYACEELKKLIDPPLGHQSNLLINGEFVEIIFDHDEDLHTIDILPNYW